MFIMIVLKWLHVHLEINLMVKILKVNKPQSSSHLPFPQGWPLNRGLTLQWNAFKTSSEFFWQSTVWILALAMMQNMKDVIALDVHHSRTCMMQDMIDLHGTAV